MKAAKYNKKSLFCKEANYIPIWNKLKNLPYFQNSLNSIQEELDPS